MKETVTIPKIVQPLTGHQTPKKRKRESRWGQRLILLLTLAVAAVIAWTLWEFLENRGIAIALFLGWILYLVIGKLFDVNGFFNAKKLFTNRLYIVLILA
jgi:xanthine/uracil permease